MHYLIDAATTRFSDGAQNKSGRTAALGDSIAVGQLRQRVSNYTPAGYYYYVISY